MRPVRRLVVEIHLHATCFACRCPPLFQMDPSSFRFFPRLFFLFFCCSFHLSSTAAGCVSFELDRVGRFIPLRDARSRFDLRACLPGVGRRYKSGPVTSCLVKFAAQCFRRVAWNCQSRRRSSLFGFSLSLTLFFFPERGRGSSETRCSLASVKMTNSWRLLKVFWVVYCRRSKWFDEINRSLYTLSLCYKNFSLTSPMKILGVNRRQRYSPVSCFRSVR